MPAPASSEEDAEYLIKVSFSKIKLFLFDKDGNELASLSVALPRVSPKLPVEGEVKEIIRKPSWGPSESTRREYLRKYKKELAKFIKYGDPDNAMGEVKIIIIFKTKGVNPIIRIHGTNKEEFIGQRVSRGCIRMRNKDILSLLDIVDGKNKIKVLFVE
jgi:L,D-transpeptidase YcfS